MNMDEKTVLDKTVKNQSPNRNEAGDVLSSLGISTAVELKDITLACVSQLIFSEATASPETAEEQFLYDVFNRLPRQGDQLLALLEHTLQQPHDHDRSLVNLAQLYQLHWVEILSLALCLAVERDAMVGRALAYVQVPVGTSRPTLGLLESALTMLVQDQREFKEIAVSVSASLLSGKAMELGLLQTNNTMVPTPEQALQIPQSVAMAMQGSWQVIKGTSLGNMNDDVYLPKSIRQQAFRHASALANTSRRALIIRSTSLQEANAIVNLIATDLQSIPLNIHSADYKSEPIGILCSIANMLPVFKLSLNIIEQQQLPELAGYDGPIVVISEPDGVIGSDTYSIMNWLVPIPKPDERYHIWSQYISNKQLAKDLAKDHRHSAGRIAELADIAKREAELHQRNHQTLKDLHKAAWSNCSDQLASLAEAINDRIEDQALILTSTTNNELQLLLQRCRNRESLVDNLGVSLTARYQPGVRSLFIGPSGTGKTLAAAWLATKLTMPLYRVDLASVLSKYIGETEKNLASLLAKAERSDVILLFDEADSLFGKRTDIKDANDRYANTQTNYLLQRIENYQGIVLLTSNSRSRFDSAFTRRIDMIIDFPAPGPQERRSLWYSHLGSQHQLTAAQVNQLSATLDLCGGHIRNAVLAAAVLAQKEQRTIKYVDVIQGLKIEYKKLAKKLPVELDKGAVINPKTVN
jgi:hypothetical protein